MCVVWRGETSKILSSNKLFLFPTIIIIVIFILLGARRVRNFFRFLVLPYILSRVISTFAYYIHLISVNIIFNITLPSAPRCKSRTLRATTLWREEPQPSFTHVAKASDLYSIS